MSCFIYQTTHHDQIGAVCFSFAWFTQVTIVLFVEILLALAVRFEVQVVLLSIIIKVC